MIFMFYFLLVFYNLLAQYTKIGMKKVYAQCDCNNAASFGVMKKIGMKCVDDKGKRTYPKTGKISGEYTCLITKDEWEKLSH